MVNPIPFSQKDVLCSDPVSLALVLRQHVEFTAVPSLDTEEGMKAAVEAMNRSTAYICYFREMESLARLFKRRAKQAKKPEEAERFLGIEEVMETYKKISEQQYECVTRLMTAKRLELDEMKMMGQQV